MKGQTIRYSDAELDFVSQNRALPRAELARQFNERFERSISTDNIKALCTRNGWKTGRNGQFVSGMTPHNKGMRQSDFLSPEGIENSTHTRFKNGLQPHNSRPLYSERINKDGYVEIKVPEENPYNNQKTRFMLKHLWVWKSANGALPKIHAIVFKDGDRTNCDLDNLECVHRRVLIAMNRQFKGVDMPGELRPSMIAVAKVTSEAARLSKEL